MAAYGEELGDVLGSVPPTAVYLREELGVVFNLLALHELLQACDLLAGSEDDKGVTGGDPIRGREDEPLYIPQ